MDNGWTANVGTAPWNVGIYRFSKESSKYNLICGRSLIAPNLVVSGKNRICVFFYIFLKKL
jgi:hypothetical protein